MTTIQIKVCGITSARQANDVLECGVDRIGLVLYRQSPRYIPFDRVKMIAESIKSGRPLTLVAVDEPLGDLVALYQRIALRTGRIQLHGHETVAYIVALRNYMKRLNLSIPEIVRRISDRNERRLYLPFADKLLWESQGAMPGGNGTLHTWPERSFFMPPERFVIAGGLTPENVSDSITATGASEVDVSSGVESEPGIKSLDKIAHFVTAVKQHVTSPHNAMT